MFELMRIMQENKHEVALFSMQDPRGKPTAYDDFFVPHTNFKAPNKSPFERSKLAGQAVYSFQARRQLRKLLAVFKPDLAHVRNIYHHLSPAILWELKQHGVKVIYHPNDFKLICPAYNMVSHGNCCELCRGSRFRHVVTSGCYTGSRASAVVLAAEAYIHRWLGTYQKCVDHFIAPSQFVKTQLVKHGFDSAKFTVLPHFQELPSQAPQPCASNAPILYFGRLSAEKGIDDLLRAIAHLPNVRLQIAGAGPHRPRLESLVRELKLNNVTFLGHLHSSELEQAITSARFTIFPSRAYETLGKSILESYACERAVIASDLGSRREFVEHGKTGFLFRTGDVDDLTRAILRLDEHPNLAIGMGKAGRKLLEEKHSPTNHYRAMLNLYEEVTQTRAQPAPLSPPKAPLRIAFIGGRGLVSRYSGIEMYYEEIGQRLARHGHEITVYCRSYFTPAIELHNGMKVRRFPTIRSKHLETFVHSLLSTLHVLFTDTQIVHYHALGSAVFSFLPRLFGKKTIVTIQGLDWQRKKWGKFASCFLRTAERAALRLPNATVVVSKTLASHYRERFASRPIYVPNGSVLRYSRNADLIKKWGLHSSNYILYLGRLSPEKNCHLLIDAYERTSTDAQLVLAGGSSYTDSYIQQLLSHRSERIKFLDWVAGEDFNELLTNAMIFVLPSDLEGLSLALLDAMGAGVCVLASDIPENREVIQTAGFTFRAGDLNDLARMLSLLTSNHEKRHTAAANARRRILDTYLWDHVTEQMEQVYAEILGRKTASQQLNRAAASRKRAA